MPLLPLIHAPAKLGEMAAAPTRSERTSAKSSGVYHFSMRRIFLFLLLLPLTLGGCNEKPPAAPDITDVFFASFLNVNLLTMAKTASGVYYNDTVVGTGATAAAGDSVTVSYSL